MIADPDRLSTLPLFDSHLHIIDPRFPLIAPHGYRPPGFTVTEYRRRMAPYDLRGGAVVSGSFQGFDQRYLQSALETLGPDFVGVTQLPASVTDAEIVRLDALGVRAVRFNLHRGGSESVDQLEYMARRVAALVGWHVELYVDAAGLESLQDTLLCLPGLCIDHLGLNRAALPLLLRLAEGGARIKATGFGRGDVDVEQALPALDAANPEALLFGTDLPSTRAPRPYAHRDFERVLDTLGESAARRVFHDNAVRLYRPRRQPG